MCAGSTQLPCRSYKAFPETQVSLGAPGTASFRHQGQFCPWLQAVYLTKTSTPPMLLVGCKNEAPPAREALSPSSRTSQGTSYPAEPC